MKTAFKLIAIGHLLSATCLSAFAQGTAFTYQGRLNDGTNPVGGTYDLRFAIYDSVSAGTLVAGPLTNSATGVSNGLFTVALDFGANAFPGANRFLEIAVRTNGGGAFATLSPRQPLTPAPYAITAGNVASGGISAGTYGSAVTFNNSANNFSGAFNGNGANVTNVNAVTLGGLGANQFWKTTGNSNTVAGANFLGTLDNQPLELRVGRLRALRLEPDPRPGPEAANLIGGFTNNTIEQPGSGGDVIVGGGYDAGINIVHSNSSGVFIGAGSANQIGPNVNDSFIGAGFGNRIQAADSVIVGGIDNFIQGDSSTIGGGYLNTIQGALYSVIGGGFQNIVQGGGNQTTIAGGELNTIGANSQNATIGGGVANRIGNDNNSATISGGSGNTVQTNAYTSTISGGYNNTIQPLAQYSTIGGGYQNTIGTNAQYAFIGGGGFNTIQPNAPGSMISGGSNNTIQTNATGSTIGGGTVNSISGSYSTIPGGYANVAMGQFSFAAGSGAEAIHDGAFVWADGSSFSAFNSSTQNEFAVRASGGVRLVTGGAGMTLDGQPVALRSGGNNFSGQQVISGGDASQLVLQNSADGRSWSIYNEHFNSSGALIFQPSSPGVGAYIRRSDGNYIVNSDARLKRDILPLSGLLDRVLQLRPVSYHFRNAPEGTPLTLGLIAQEVEPLFPEVVSEHDGIKSMAYSELIPVTIRAVQELNQKLTEELKRRDAENAELKQRLDALEEFVHSHKSITEWK